MVVEAAKALTEFGTRNIKIIILIALFVITTIFCFLPQVVIFLSNKFDRVALPLTREEFKKRRRKRRFRKNSVSLMNCFASGVFLGVCLLDLLPEVEENIEQFVTDYRIDINFPLAQFCVVVGFLLLMILEQVATLFKKDSSNPFVHHHHHGGPDSLVSSTASTILPLVVADFDGSFQHHHEDFRPPHHHPHHHHHHRRRSDLNDSTINLASSSFASHPSNDDNMISVNVNDGYDNIDIEDKPLLSDRFSQSLSLHSPQHQHHDHQEVSRQHPQTRNSSESENLTEKTTLLATTTLDEEIENQAELEETEIEQAEISTDPRAHSNVRYVMLAIALSVHSIFEGLALGLEPKIASIFQLFIAIAIHKCVVAFSFGLNMSQSALNTCTKFFSLVVFCLASPVGAVVGLGIEMVSFNKGTAGAIIGSLQGLACGSFIYVVFFELLPHEFFTYRKRPSPLLKVLMLIFGISLMSLVMLIEPAE
ncbi:hypothetical protein HELRODRAFT_94735 [Helobdella robusta]|uniref:Uncharacterized protein n=1 Tax=Helobdella robusta TaxID=6412 RepID=T1G927_HELRO|nr:hypothetical protein HELRODRAFT_94735 [Helobdella robusta]ESO02681.1 hypothetical protein HELRODRAFT_94735 [Helobdella robusta]